LIDMLIILPLAFVVQSRVLPIGDFFFFPDSSVLKWIC